MHEHIPRTGQLSGAHQDARGRHGIPLSRVRFVLQEFVWPWGASVHTYALSEQGLAATAQVSLGHGWCFLNSMFRCLCIPPIRSLARGIGSLCILFWHLTGLIRSRNYSFRCGIIFFYVRLDSRYNVIYTAPLTVISILVICDICFVLMHRNYRCQQCGNRYATPAALRHHIETTEHKFPCTVCKKVFHCERFLRRHLHTHSSESESTCVFHRPFNCAYWWIFSFRERFERRRYILDLPLFINKYIGLHVCVGMRVTMSWIKLWCLVTKFVLKVFSLFFSALLSLVIRFRFMSLDLNSMPFDRLPW